MSAWAGIGDVLPLAVGVAISPFPMMAAILMLLAPKGRSTAVGFLVGWMLGVIITLGAFTLLGEVIPESEATPEGATIRALVQLVLGLLLIWLAVRQWRGRPKADGEAPAMPAWMSAIDTMKPGAALLMGLLLSSVNPKSLLLHLSAGIGLSGIVEGGALVTAFIVYAVVASATVGGPVICYLIAPATFEKPLTSLREWLVQNNTAVMTVLLLVIGISLVGKGLAVL